MNTLQRIVGGALILGGARLPRQDVHQRRTRATRRSCSPARDKLIAVAIGAFGGFVVGLTSVGSGTFFGLAMLFAYPLTAQKIVGTDMFHAAVLLWVAGTSHLLHGDVDTHAMAWLLVGSIPGVLIGSSLSIKIPERALRVAFGCRADPLRDQARRRAVRELHHRGRRCLHGHRARRLARAAAQSPPLGAACRRERRRRIDRAVARMLSTAFCVALLAATAVAFALTEGAKTELSPLYGTKIAKVFSPVCDPSLCRGSTARIDFKLRERQRLEVWMQRNGKRVATIVLGRTFPKGEVNLAFTGLTRGGVFLPDGSYKPVVRFVDQHRTITLPNLIQIDTEPRSRRGPRGACTRDLA